MKHGCNGTCPAATVLHYLHLNIYKMTIRTNKLFGRLALHSVLCASLFAPVLMAQEFPPTDRELRQGMSYEEYSAHREKMRLRMEKMHAEEQKRSSETQKPQTEHTEKPRPDSAYGQGFHTRNRPEEKHDAGRANRQDRPNFERFNRNGRSHR